MNGRAGQPIAAGHGGSDNDCSWRSRSAIGVLQLVRMPSQWKPSWPSGPHPRDLLALDERDARPSRRKMKVMKDLFDGGSEANVAAAWFHGKALVTVPVGEPRPFAKDEWSDAVRALGMVGTKPLAFALARDGRRVVASLSVLACVPRGCVHRRTRASTRFAAA